MNGNGLCSMEIDDASAVCGRNWDQLWPEETRNLVIEALPAASKGETVKFNAFCPTAKGTPKWWNVTVSRVNDVNDAQVGYLAISRDITETETQRQALLIAAEEMRHRLRNTYMMIGSLFRGFAKGNTENEQFALDMQSRLTSLCAAQSLFSTMDAPCDLSTLIPALVDPFSSPICPISIDGTANILIRQGEADAIALVLGELAVNSTKHGALAHGGRIVIKAKLSDRDLEIVWDEKSTSPVVGTSRLGGQGLSLIERIVKARNGSLTVEWGTHGLVVTAKFRNP